MDWKSIAIDELREYRELEMSVINLADELDRTRSAKTSLRSSGNTAPVHGGGNAQEDKLLNLICREELLTEQLKNARRKKKRIDRGLSVLTDEERKILKRFYIDGMSYSRAVDCLRDEIGYEESQINRKRNAALKKYTRAEFGAVES